MFSGKMAPICDERDSARTFSERFVTSGSFVEPYTRAANASRASRQRMPGVRGVAELTGMSIGGAARELSCSEPSSGAVETLGRS